MLRVAILISILFFLFVSCPNDTSQIDIKSNITSAEFEKRNGWVDYYQFMEIEDIEEMDFAIKYKGHTYGRRSAICNILITKRANQYHFECMQRYYSHIRQEFDTMKNEGEITQFEVDNILRKIKDSDLPNSIKSSCMHSQVFEIQLKFNKSYWTTRWCSFRYENLMEDKAQYIENAILELVELYPTQVRANITNIKQSDSLGFEVFVTSGFKSNGIKCLFDSRSIKINSEGICEFYIHQKDTVNWTKRLDLFEIRKDKTLHEITSAIRIIN